MNKKIKLPNLRLILILALIIRTALPALSWTINADTQRFFYSDTATYLQPAQTLLSIGHYSVNDQPELLRPPGYPVLLLPGLLTNAVVFLTLLLQIILSTITVALIYQITYTLTQKTKPAQYAGLLAAIEPLSIIYTSILLTETLFTTLLMFGLWLMIRATHQSRTRDIIIAACLFASATYVRPIGLYLPIVLAIPLFLSVWPKHRVILFLVIALGLPGIWMVRNIAVANYSGFSAISAINLYFYQSAAVKAAKTQTPFVEYQNRLGYRDHDQYLTHHPDQKDWTPAQRYQYMAKKGIKIIFDSPITYTTIHLKGVFRTLFDPGAIDLLKLLNAYPQRGGLLGQISDRGLLKTIRYLLVERPLVFGAHLVMGVLLLAYYFLAAVHFKRKPALPTIILLITICYFTLLSGGPHSLNRFRHPIMPLITIFAGTGLAILKRPAQSP